MSAGIVEFIGVPGSGKSTILNLLARKSPGRYSTAARASYLGLRRFLSDCRPVHKNPAILPYSIARSSQLIRMTYPYRKKVHEQFALEYCGFFAISEHLLSNAELSFDELYYRVNALVDRLVDYALCKEYFGGGGVLVDEGLGQQVTMVDSIADENARVAGIESFANSVPPPAVMVLLSSSVETSISRIEVRAKRRPKRWNSLSLAELGDKLSRVGDYLDRYARVVADRGVPVFRLETDGRTPGSVIDELDGLVGSDTDKALSQVGRW